MLVDDVLLIERFGRLAELGAPVTAIQWIGDEAAVALGDGSVRFLGRGERERRVEAHDGAILSAAPAPDGSALLTGGDDGRVLRVTASGEVSEWGQFGRWVDHLVASAASGLIVAGIGKEAIVWTSGASAPSHRFAFPSTIGGMAFDGKGKRLAVAHYGGASLLFAMSAASSPQHLPWAGSHLACTFRPDGDYLITATQELGLHGWKLPEKTDMEMSGYRSKTRSFSWSKRGRLLATGGDDSVILWPFEGKDGPMGKRPYIGGKRDAVVTQVAFQPVTDMLAVGYDDGAVTLLRLNDDAALLVEEPGGGTVTALAWARGGTALAYGREDGRIGLLDMEAKAPAEHGR